MLHIGCHLSSSKGFLAMGRQAWKLGADSFLPGIRGEAKPKSWTAPMRRR